MNVEKVHLHNHSRRPSVLPVVHDGGALSVQGGSPRLGIVERGHEPRLHQPTKPCSVHLKVDLLIWCQKCRTRWPAQRGGGPPLSIEQLFDLALA